MRLRRTLVKSLALSRIPFGAALIVAPGPVAAGSWIGPAAGTSGAQVLARAFGIRDLALGLGAFLSLQRGEDAEDWVALQLVSDLVDFGATLAAGDDIPELPRRIVLGAAGSAVAICALWLLAPEAEVDRTDDATAPGSAGAYAAGPPAATTPPPPAAPAAPGAPVEPASGSGA